MSENTLVFLITLGILMALALWVPMLILLQRVLKTLVLGFRAEAITRQRQTTASEAEW
jgi:hypothetical protein